MDRGVRRADGVDGRPGFRDPEGRGPRGSRRKTWPAATICRTPAPEPRFNTQTVDAALRWQVPDDGLYQVLISDLYASQRGHPRLTYRLVIRREQPDFALVLRAE